MDPSPLLGFCFLWMAIPTWLKLGIPKGARGAIEKVGPCGSRLELAQERFTRLRNLRSPAKSD